MRQYFSPRAVFLSAIVLLLLSATATGWTVYKLYESEDWVRHTFEVEVRLAGIESGLTSAGRSRMMFVGSGDPRYLQDFAEGRRRAFDNLTIVRDLTSDNAEEQDRCNRLETAMTNRLAVVQKGIDLAKSGNTDKLAQAELTASVTEWANQTDSIIAEMDQAEEILLRQRTKITGKFFRMILEVLLTTFLLAIFLIWEHYKRLAQELRERTMAEERSRALSVQVLRAQDDERRRVARELHDSAGQYLAAMQMNLLAMVNDSEQMAESLRPRVQDSIDLASRCAAEIRTVSYLLHPPLLDEVGLSSAIPWYVEGFSERSGIKVTLDVLDNLPRFSRDIETAVFRIVQQGLANIHRHSQSKVARIRLRTVGKYLTIEIIDEGKGLDHGVMAKIRMGGQLLGVGISGMVERVKGLGGKFDIFSSAAGTTIAVSLPADPPQSARGGADLRSDAHGLDG